MKTDWMKFGKCVGLDPILFFPPPGDRGTMNTAKAVCFECPVREQCLTFGLNQGYGIWGGMSERERRKERTRRLRAVV